MDQFIFQNDRVVTLAESRLSPGQMGLLMGWGVFTTLRIYRGVPFAFELHWARMERDAKRLGVQIAQTQSTVHKALQQLTDANHRTEGMARVSFIRNLGGLWAQAPNRPSTDLLIFTREVASWPAAHRLSLQPMGIFSGGRFAGAKMLSWVQHAALLETALEEGYDETLLLNEKDQLSECTSANVFLVKQGKVLTPPLSSGCLPGITREILLQQAPIGRTQLHERDLTVDDLSSADEVFVTSTTREVAAVKTISPHWNYPAPGQVTVSLAKTFRQYVQDYVGRALSS